MARFGRMYHSTCTWWLDAISERGVGAVNPHDALGTWDVFQRMRPIVETLPELAGLQEKLNMVASQNPLFRYGQLYVTPSMPVAQTYTKNAGGELFHLMWQMAEAITELGNPDDVPDWRGWNLLPHPSVQLILDLGPSNPSKLRRIDGGPLRKYDLDVLQGKFETLPSFHQSFQFLGTVPWSTVRVYSPDGDEVMPSEAASLGCLNVVATEPPMPYKEAAQNLRTGLEFTPMAAARGFRG